MLKQPTFALFVIIVAAGQALAADSAAIRKQKKLQAGWYHCLQVYGLKVAAKTREPAETVADAAMTACQAQGGKLFRHFQNEPAPLAEILISEVYPAQERHYRAKILSEILALRASQ